MPFKTPETAMYRMVLIIRDPKIAMGKVFLGFLTSSAAVVMASKLYKQKILWLHP